MKKNILTCLFLIISNILFAQVEKDYEVKVQNYMGIPTLMVNGQPDAGMTYMTYRPQERFFSDFGKAGVRFVSFETLLQKAWVSRDSLDFHVFDSIMNFIIKANPNALIFPRVYLFAPDWWMKENPDELMVYQDGVKFKPTRGWPKGTTLPSWASEKWRKDTELCLRKLIQHIKKQSWGSHIVGYHLASGGTDEWYYYSYYNWFFNAPQEEFLDYSMPQTKAFRLWLKKKYGSLENLQTAWHNNTVTFDNANIVSKRDRQKQHLILPI